MLKDDIDQDFRTIAFRMAMAGGVIRLANEGLSVTVLERDPRFGSHRPRH